MSLIDKKENEKKYTNNHKILIIIKLVEKILNNYIINYEYMFFDILLKEWYTTNQNILEDKIDNLKEVNSIYIYNYYKTFLYDILNIFHKNKIYYFFYFIKNIQIILLKKKYFIHIIENLENKNKIKNAIIDIFILLLKNKLLNKTTKNEELISFYIGNNKIKTNIKLFFCDRFININNLKLKAQNRIIKSFLIGKFINNYNIKVNLYLYYNNWKIYSFEKIEKLYNFYFYKIKFFQINNILFLYKIKLKSIYNIFINNFENYCSSNFNINEKNKIIKNNTISLFQPIKNILITYIFI